MEAAMHQTRLRQLLALSAWVFGAAWAGQALSQGARNPEPDALIAAARKEGEVVVYSSSPDNQMRRVVAAFTAKYGLKTSFVRLGSTLLQQRYATEAEAGNIAADILLNAGSAAKFAEECIARGWAEPIGKAGIPAIDTGEYPARFNRGVVAVIQITPWVIAYNSERVKGADIPKTFRDALHPRFRNQIIMPDPRESDAYLDGLAVLLSDYGPEYFTQLLAQNPRIMPTSAVAVQSLGAGEGSIMFLTSVARALEIKSKGGPVDIVFPESTSGIEIQAMLTHRARAKHPAAARLFAHYIMSLDGNRVYNDELGGASLYDPAGLPKRYQSPKPETLARKAELLKHLGLAATRRE
jgi:iron(III) transport system substrate-binding protein